MAVAEPHRHPDHGHDAVGASEGEARVEPGRGRAEGVDQPQVHHGRQLEHERVHERDERGDAPLLGLRHGGGVARLDRARREGDLVHVVVLLAQVAHGHHVGHPLNQAALLVEWRHRVALHGKPAAAAVGRLVQQPVDGRHELHHARVLAQVSGSK